MSVISTVKTDLTWYQALQFSPEEGCPVLVAMLADECLMVTIAQISPNDNCWRSVPDDERLDPDDIEMWAEITLPKFHN